MATVAIWIVAPAAAKADAIVGSAAFNPATGHRYVVVGSTAAGAGMSWPAAEAFAVGTFGSHLATVNDAAENDWIFQTFENTPGTVSYGVDPYLWIGLNDLAAEAGSDPTSINWAWAAGGNIRTTGYSNWDVGEPNDRPYPPIGEDYVSMFRRGDGAVAGRWNDTWIDGTSPTFLGVVEIDSLFWRGNNGDAWSNPSSWNIGNGTTAGTFFAGVGVPSTGESAIFDRDSTVALSAPTAAKNLTVANGAVTMNLAGQSLALSSQLRVYSGLNAQPTLTLKGPGVVNVADQILIGAFQTPGNLSVTGGAQLSSIGPIFIAEGGGAVTTVVVDGIGSRLSTDGSINLGYSSGAPSAGIVTVKNGGVIAASIELRIAEGNFASSDTLNIQPGGRVEALLLRTFNNSRVNLSGGTLQVGALDLAGDTSRLVWTSGTLDITGSNLTLGTGSLVGTSLPSIDAAKTLLVSGAGRTLRINPGGSLSVNGGTVHVTGLDASSADSFAFTAGTITVDGGPFKPKFDASDSAVVSSADGSPDRPSLALQAGAGAIAPAGHRVFVGSFGGRGALTVTGAGSSFAFDRGTALYIGDGFPTMAASDGSLTVASGGTIGGAGADVLIGFGGGHGVASVSGNGSQLIASSLAVGYESTGATHYVGDGTLDVIDGAHVVTTLGFIGGNSGVGVVNVGRANGVDTGGSLLQVSTDLTLSGASGGFGTLRQRRGGAITVGGTLSLGNGATLERNVSSPLANDGVRVAGNVTLHGHLTFTTVSSQPAPALGTHVDAVTLTGTATTVIGGFDTVAGVDLGNGLRLGQSAASGPGALSFLVTYGGDTDLNLAVAFSDLLTLARSYGITTGGTWRTGDSDYDHDVDFNDLLTLAKNYGKGPAAPAVGPIASLDPAFADEWALAQSLAPEPTSVAMVIGLSMAGVRRRSLRRAEQ